MGRRENTIISETLRAKKKITRRSKSRRGPVETRENVHIYDDFLLRADTFEMTFLFDDVKRKHVAHTTGGVTISHDSGENDAGVGGERAGRSFGARPRRPLSDRRVDARDYLSRRLFGQASSAKRHYECVVEP